MQYYLAGMMRRQAWYGFYTFEAVEQALREWLKGDENLVIINPHTEDAKMGFDVKELPADYDWSGYPPGFDVKDCCERCYRAATESDYIVMLPGWELGTNAKIEKGLAEWVGKGVLYVHRRVHGGWDFLSKSNVASERYVFEEEVRRFKEPFPSANPENKGVEGGKATNAENPKDAIGSGKLPIHLWPTTATMMGCIGLLNGMLKYGRGNWKAAGVRASIYYDACHRHLDAWFEGEDIDPDDNVPHLAAALACLAIIVDAQAAGKLNDDRNVAGGYRELRDQLSPLVAMLKEQHKDKSPKHWTIKD